MKQFKNNKGSGQLPDLLYPEKRFSRVKLCSRIFSRDTAISPDLHRVTLFLTFKCNLACYYCNTIKPAENPDWPTKGKTYSFGAFKSFMGSLTQYRIHHLHLTGGEVTLVKQLPDIIQYATTLSIPCSITTNGTAPVRVYEDLVNSGLKEIRISLDTLDPEQFDRNVGKTGAFKKVLKTINGIVALRDVENRDIYLILNVCVSRYDVSRLPETIQSLIELGPDDIKLIGISHEREKTNAVIQTMNVVDHIQAHIDAASPRQFPLLTKKLKTIFSTQTYGLNDFASKGLMQSCFVPLTERTVDSRFYYPCPVYLREGGPPLGTIDEDIKTQEKKIRRFIQTNTCLNDPICINFCIYCTKVFNNHMNSVVYRRVKKKSGQFEPITREIRYEKEISIKAIVQKMDKITQQRNRFTKNPPCQPFIVLKPNGIPFEKLIRIVLKENHIHIISEHPLPDWNRMAGKIYTYPATMWNLYRSVLFEKVLPVLEGRSNGKIWVLKGNPSCSELKKVKRKIRKLLPPENYMIHHQDEVFITSPGFLHTPDRENIGMEWQTLGAEICLDFDPDQRFGG